MKHWKAGTLWIVGCAIALALAAPDARAQKKERNPFVNRMNVIEFAELAIFFEFNSTDLDLGIQLFFDADGWDRVWVRGPDGIIFRVRNYGALKDLGSTEVFTESEEPELDEANLGQEIADFLNQFPEGDYTFIGKTIEGDWLAGTAELTHDLPIPVTVDVSAFPLISWTDESMAGDPVIVRYQAVLELVVEIDDEEEVFVFVVDLPAGFTEVTVPDEFLDAIDAFDDIDAILELKVELIAEEESGNKSITEVVLIEEED